MFGVKKSKKKIEFDWKSIWDMIFVDFLHSFYFNALSCESQQNNNEKNIDKDSMNEKAQLDVAENVTMKTIRRMRREKNVLIKLVRT